MYSNYRTKLDIITIVVCCIRDGYEVAVIYFRCGYVPEHYPSQKVSYCVFFMSCFLVYLLM